MKRGVNAALDQQRQCDPSEISADEREKPKHKNPPITLNKKFDPVVMAKNRLILLLGNPAAVEKQTGPILPHKKIPLWQRGKQEDSPTADNNQCNSNNPDYCFVTP